MRAKMKFVKTAVIISLCLALVMLNLFTVNATTTPNINISTKTANLGDTVTIDINISNNPGIMAMAFCIVYDSDSLSFESYEKGYLSSCTLKDHSDKGHVSFVNVEGSDKTNNGKIISLCFKVKDNAKSGLHQIYLANSDRQKNGNKLHNSFANSKQDYIIPTVTSGGIIILGNCQTEHKYGSWHTTKDANCAETGLKNRTCELCGYNEEVIITVPHNFETEWTIDKAATPDTDGEMSRHCTDCDATTDKIIFSYEEIGGDETPDDNTSSDTTSDTTNSENTSDITSDNVNNDDTDNSITNSSADSNNSSTDNKKPSIDNIVGEKVPQQEAEKLENYPQVNKPEQENPGNDNITSDNSSSQETVSKDETLDSSTVIERPENEYDSFFTTPTGIAMIIVCAVLSIGVLALGVMLIIRNKKR